MILSMTQGQLAAEISAGIIFITFVVMQWHKKLPSVAAIQELASVVNSRGGNIMVLAGFSIMFFSSALRFTYWFMERAAEGKVSAQDTLGLAAFTWVTGTAFGGAFTSMVKAMTGENTKARSSDDHPSPGTTVTTTTTTPTPVAPHTEESTINFTPTNGGNK